MGGTGDTIFSVVFDCLFAFEPIIWVHRARRMRHAMPIPEECGHIYRMSIMGQTLRQAFCINRLGSSLHSDIVGIIPVVAWDGREGHW